MYQDPRRFLHKITGYSWEHITERALKLRKVSKVPGSVVAVVSDHHESLLGSTMNPMIYYLPDGRTLHHLHRVFWSEFLEKGVMKYGVETFPAMRFDLEDLPKISLKRLIYPYLIEGTLSLKGDLVISHQHRMNMTTFDVTKFRIEAESEVSKIISHFAIGAYQENAVLSVKNTFFQNEFFSNSFEITAVSSIPESISFIASSEIHSFSEIIGTFKVESNLSFLFEGRASHLPPEGATEKNSQESYLPLTNNEQAALGGGLLMTGIMIFAMIALVPIGA